MTVTKQRVSEAPIFLKFLQKYVHYLLLAGIIIVAIAIRWVSADFTLIHDYDPWWFYRHALEIYNNNLAPPRWDILSHYPPGRPVDYPLGWSYTMAVSYAITESIHSLSLMKFAGLFTAIFAGLSTIPAYMIGRMLTNKWGGLITALFVGISPNFLVVSMAGYTDSDAAVVFYTLLAILTTVYAIRKAEKLNFGNFSDFCRSLGNYLPYLIPSMIAYWLFAVNWNFSWYIYFIFLFFIPILILFRLFEAKVFSRERGHLDLIHRKIRESRNIIIPIILIGIFGEVITLFTNAWPYNTAPLHKQLIGGLSFLNVGIPEEGLFIILFASIGAIAGLSVGKVKGLSSGAVLGLVVAVMLIPAGTSGQTGNASVNISVSELQPVNLLSLGDDYLIASRIGGAPLIVGGFGFLALIAFKLARRREITAMECFVLTWIFISLFLTVSGTRFSLLLSLSTAIAAGFVIGNLVQVLNSKKTKKSLETSVYLYGLLIFGLALQVYVDFNTANYSSEILEPSPKWVEALTWLKQNADNDAFLITVWDRGHIITGFTSLKAHSDGAHCGGCVPYSLNERLADTGTMFSTVSEDEAIGLVRKYASMSVEDCSKARDIFGSIMPQDACKGASDVFVITSASMVKLYSWMDYFRSYSYKSDPNTDSNYYYLELTGKNKDETLVYGNGKITIEHKNGQLTPLIETHVIEYPSGEVRATKFIVREMIYYDERGNEKRLDLSDSASYVKEGLIWLAPDKRVLAFVDDKAKDSIFSKLFFFYGDGLEHFKLVFENPEFKIYRVIL